MNYRDLKESLSNRFTAIATAYGLQDDVRSMESFPHLCKIALVGRNLGRKYEVFRPHVQRGLELGAIYGDANKWVEISRSKGSDYYFGKSLKKFKDLPDFQAKYRQRFLEVMHSLDLAELEHLVIKDDSGSDFIKTGFNPKFYENFLSEYCGITVDEGWSKRSFIAQSKSKHSRHLEMSYDPINIIRTYYIMKEILEINLDVSLDHIKMIGRVSALDLILTLNIIYEMTDENLPEDERKEKVTSLGEHFDQKIVDNQLVWQVSLPQCFNILKDIGFSQEEVRKLWFESGDIRLLSDICCRILDYDSIDIFMDTMQKRMQLLALEGVKLGVGDVRDTYHFLVNWDDVVEALDAADLRNNPCYVRFNKANINIGSLPHKTARISSSRMFLIQYLGYQKTDKEKIKEFDKIFNRVPHAKDVPLKIVVETLELLESLNFTRKQIEKGFPILFYDKEIIAEKIDEAARNMGEEWIEKENALCVLNYLIEVQTNFSFTDIYSGILRNFQRGLSLDEFHALSNKQNGDSIRAKFRKIVKS